MKNPKGYLNFLGRRFKSFDCDYLRKLSEDDAQWLAEHMSSFYGQKKGCSKEDNRRRYSEQVSDCYRTNSLERVILTEDLICDDLDPETFLLLKEKLED